MLWGRFRKFCGCTFQGPKDLLTRMVEPEEGEKWLGT